MVECWEKSVDSDDSHEIPDEKKINKNNKTFMLCLEPQDGFTFFHFSFIFFHKSPILGIWRNK